MILLELLTHLVLFLWLMERNKFLKSKKSTMLTEVLKDLFCDMIKMKLKVYINMLKSWKMWKPLPVNKV